MTRSHLQHRQCSIMAANKFFFAFIVFVHAIILPLASWSYPLDGYDETDIKRLEGYYFSLPTPSGFELLTAGALLSIQELNLSHPIVQSYPPKRDPYLQQSLQSLVGQYKGAISVSLLDLSQPENPAYASVNDEVAFVPGSVGKIMIAVSLFDALSRIYPHSTSDRQKLLKSRILIADSFIDTDEHVVPFWALDTRTIFFRPLQHGDTANLYSFLDFMLSSSSNAAGSMIMREVLLMNYLGSRYPSTNTSVGILEKLSQGEIQQLMYKSFVRPLQRLGVSIFQGSFFTAYGKKFAASVGSSATTRDLVHLLLMLEQGKVIDEFSSLEIKRLLYLTQKRERYAGAAVLNDSAVYFKAGSLLKCTYEPGYICQKYEGNRDNTLNGVALVESPVANPVHRYIVAVSTNILRRNSEELHRQLADGIDAIVKLRQGR